MYAIGLVDEAIDTAVEEDSKEISIDGSSSSDKGGNKDSIGSSGSSISRDSNKESGDGNSGR